MYSMENEYILAENYIDKWMRKDSSVLNIITVPYASNSIFTKIIYKQIKDNKRVLYILAEDKKEMKIFKELSDIKKRVEFIEYSNLNNIKDKFDLVIYDDISSYSDVTISKVTNCINYIKRNTHKIIVYTIEKIGTICDSLEIVPIIDRIPYKEPRIITTKINLNKEIPYSLYEYYKWFYSLKRNVVLFVPKEFNIDDIYRYYKEQISLKDLKILSISSQKDIKKVMKYVNRDNNGNFIITNIIGEYIKLISHLDVVVLLADNPQNTYKEFVYLCGNVYRSNKTFGEIILVGNSITEDMEKCKDILREFNKLAWKRKYLN